MLSRCVFIVFTLLLALPLQAGIRGPETHVVYSSDGKRILVMRHRARESDPGADIVLPDGRHINVYDIFSECGVYEIDTFKQLWFIDQYSYPGAICYSDDLQYLVRMTVVGRPIRYKLQFFDRGRLVCEYDKDDLLTSLKSFYFMPDVTRSSFRWYDRFYMSSDRKSILVDTSHRYIQVLNFDVDLGLQEFYAFDLATGRMLNKRVTGIWVIWAWLTGLLVVITAFIVAAWFMIKLTYRYWLKYMHQNRRGFPVD